MDADYPWAQNSDSDYQDPQIDSNQMINTPEKKGENKIISEEDVD